MQDHACEYEAPVRRLLKEYERIRFSIRRTNRLRPAESRIERDRVKQARPDVPSISPRTYISRNPGHGSLLVNERSTPPKREDGQCSCASLEA